MDLRISDVPAFHTYPLHRIVVLAYESFQHLLMHLAVDQFSFLISTSSPHFCCGEFIVPYAYPTPVVSEFRGGPRRPGLPRHRNKYGHVTLPQLSKFRGHKVCIRRTASSRQRLGSRYRGPRPTVFYPPELSPHHDQQPPRRFRHIHDLHSTLLLKFRQEFLEVRPYLQFS